MKEFSTTNFISYGAVIKGYITISEEMFTDIDKLSQFLNESYDYVMSLEPKKYLSYRSFLVFNVSVKII